jgi:exodeoxyribonuclease VII large subunit
MTEQPSSRGPGLRVLSVGDVTHAIREALRTDPILRDLWVEGEVGRVSISAAGHAYFSLKDDRGLLDCVIFSRERAAAAFDPETGHQVVVHGRIDVFEQQGRVQLYVDAIQPAGFGDLALRVEALKTRLAAEGLFDAARKRPLPARPSRIAAVTSPTGAVWHDIRNVVERRWPLVELMLVPCLVQGDGAPAAIVAAFRRISALPTDERPDVVILARGGGSLEDLAAFNDEAVLRAIVASLVPVVVGVGHETDVTLADFAADLRAPTPSAAAELVVPSRAEMRASLGAVRLRLDRLAASRVALGTTALANEWRALEGLGPLARIDLARERAGALLDRATVAVRTVLERRAVVVGRALVPLASTASMRIARARATLDAAAAGLDALDPRATLERGYAIVRRAGDGRIVRDPADLALGGVLAVRVALGDFGATVTDLREPSAAPSRRPGDGSPP